MLALLLLIRGSTAAASVTNPIWSDDYSRFYGLQAFPVLLELSIVCITTVLARIGNASLKWPIGQEPPNKQENGAKPPV